MTRDEWRARRRAGAWARWLERVSQARRNILNPYAGGFSALARVMQPARYQERKDAIRGCLVALRTLPGPVLP